MSEFIPGTSLWSVVVVSQPAVSRRLYRPKWLWSVPRGVLTFPKALTTVRALLCFSDGRVPRRGEKKNLEFTYPGCPAPLPFQIPPPGHTGSDVLFLVLTSFIHSASIHAAPLIRDQHWFLLGAQKWWRSSHCCCQMGRQGAVNFPGAKLPALPWWQPLGPLQESRR